ncbi:MLX-interacting protein isoform X1 [Athalia rosae]|uniref:MLX-interacting protein isoform X1 n=2 Tax=Athalia rosae TaxID=37344 RepID=UPI002034A351|nr:MLX-interacting protein isoform X1 [Athalia rosae]
MQTELMYRKATVMGTPQGAGTAQTGLIGKRESKDSRETIHSGHFMVSDFEAEAQDEDELAVPVPEEEAARLAIIAPPGFSLEKFVTSSSTSKTSTQQLSIETSLNKLFQCMSLAYRQKLTSPKWNRFKGIRLRWKDKIRLNNVIWRCWHMQFILKQNTLVCQFASPLDVDTHNKPEAVVLEGKYWKRKLAAVTAEYKKWRMFYRNKILGWTNKDGSDMSESMDMLDWDNGLGIAGGFGVGMGSLYGVTGGALGGDSLHSMMVDEDYMELMTDTLFSTISSNQPFHFPDPREIARVASLADFIQPSLGPLQPNLDDFMDTLEPLQEFFNQKLPPVPEEDDMFRSGTMSNTYPELELMPSITQVNQIGHISSMDTQSPSGTTGIEQQHSGTVQNLQYTAKTYDEPQQQPQQSTAYRNNISNISENYNTVQQGFDATPRQTSRGKGRQSRSTTRNNHLVQQSQQQNAYQQPRQQQNLAYQQPTSQQQQQNYSMDIQGVQLSPVPNQATLTSLNNQVANTSHISPITSHVQNYAQPNSPPQTQQRSIRPMPPTTSAPKPYKAVQPVQGYKFTLPAQKFTPQQCKFSSSSYKSSSAQQVSPMSTTLQAQSHVLGSSFQCRPLGSLGLDPTAPAQHPAKLLPRPTPATGEKEEVFAVPKYQMKSRNRSRSSSSLVPPRLNPPPLVSAISDPALNLNNNVLLAQLLTNNTSSLYTVTSGPDKAASVNQTSGVKHILPMPPPPQSPAQTSSTTLLITTPVTVQSIQAAPVQVQQQAMQTSGQPLLLSANSQSQQSIGSPGSPKDNSSAHSPQGLNLSPLHSPMSIGSPLSPGRVYVKGDPERGQYKEQRRVGHIHAEQKRRYNIKNGFDMLHSLIPQLNQNPNTKLSKAAMLQKGADYVRQLRAERNQLKDEMDSLRQQIECLNSSISNCQSMLPATGAPVSRHRTSKMKEMFDDYVRTRTRENWKFWIFSILLEPLMVSFNTSVSTASIEDLYRSTMLWVEQHCSLVDLRPAVLNSLRYLCTATEILSDPSRLPEEALAAVNQTDRQRPNQ